MQKYWRRCWFFLLCGCNHRDTEYKLSDSTGGSTAETVFGNQKEVDEEQTVSEKSAGETTGIPEKREAQEAAPEETVQVYICGAVASPVSTRYQAEAA